MDKVVIKEQIVKITNETFKAIVKESVEQGDIYFDLDSAKARAIVIIDKTLYEVRIDGDRNSSDSICVSPHRYYDGPLEGQHLLDELSKKMKANLERRYEVVRKWVEI